MRPAAHAAIVCGVILSGTVGTVTGAPRQQLVERAASTAAAPAPEIAAPAAPTTAPASVLPSGYVIGADDVLSIVFWKDKEMSAEVTVRPDGKVALPLLNDLQAAGLTPDGLRDRVIAAARKYVEDPNPTVIVKTINSRKVFITGQVEKPGTYALNNPVTVLQLIAMAGGLRDFAKGKNISVLRTEDGRQVFYGFNYQEVVGRKNLDQNIDLRPGDTVVVP
ncbi:MAG: polysaccharide biosynthesis/export family protein [Vicinamibacterales bacterium]